jgi:hypothetical protein
MDASRDRAQASRKAPLATSWRVNMRVQFVRTLIGPEFTASLYEAILMGLVRSLTNCQECL